MDMGTTEITDVPPLQLPMALNQVHLEVLHNFMTLTIPSLSTEPIMQTVWRVNVVQLGLERSFVMRAILALSALHLSYLKPEKKDFYLSVAQSEHFVALRSATALLPSISEDSSSALYIVSIFIFFYRLGSPHEPGDLLFATSSGMPEWLRLFRGTRGIIEASFPHLREGPFSTMFRSGAARIMRAENFMRTSQSWLETDEHKQLAGVLQHLRENVRDLDRLAMYAEHLEHLETCFCAARLRPATDFEEPLLEPKDTDATSSNIFSFLFRTSDEFIALLGAREPYPLVIFGHYCVLLNTLARFWWMRRQPCDLMQEIWDAMDEANRIWLRWPIEQIGWIPSQSPSQRNST